MAHVKINKKEFDKLVGDEIPEEKLHEEASLLGAHWNHVEGDKWDVEVYPNRPDLLSVEGLARAYKGFFGVENGRENYVVNEGDIEVEVDESVEKVRPHIGCAVLRDVELTQRILNGLIQFQEKLHETLGRKRDKLAIGLHDLSAVEPPFSYKAVEPEQVAFTPLEYDKEMQLGQILDEHEKGRKYSWILEDEEKYPIIVDSEDQVLSFPPIINNQLTEVETGTTEIFIDVTGKDLKTVRKCLNILVTSLAERGAKIDSVEVDGEEMPDLSPQEKILDPDYLRQISGLDLGKTEIMDKLKQMRYGVKGAKNVKAEIPCYRNDVMHQYDLIEDVVIAHRYTRIEPELAEIDQIGSEDEMADFEEIVREVLVGTGALESHNYVLSNREKLFEKMEKEGEKIVEMSNALTEDYTAVRNWLMPSMLQILTKNRHHSYPQKFFETGEVVVTSDSALGAENRRKAAYLASGEEVDFTSVRKILQVLERDLGIELEVKETGEPYFKDSRAGKIILSGEEVGVIGEFSDQVLENWELEKGTAGFELNLERLKEIR